jgi:hypothetical protein
MVALHANMETRTLTAGAFECLPKIRSLQLVLCACGVIVHVMQARVSCLLGMGEAASVQHFVGLLLVCTTKVA